MSYFTELTDRQAKNEELATRAVEIAKQKGADEAKVIIFSGKGIEVSSRHCEVENIEFNQDQSMEVIVYKNKKMGRVSTTDLSLDAITSCVDAALNISEYTSVDECAGICEKELQYQRLSNGKHEHELDLLFEIVEDPDLVVEKAINLEKLAVSKLGSVPNLKDSDGSCFENSYVLRTLANSNGFVDSFVESYASKSLGLLAELGEEKQRASSYSVKRDYTKLWSDERIVDEAIERTVNKIGARQVKTGSYPIILSHRAATSLISNFLSAIMGNAIYRKSSFLCDSIGKDVFPNFLQIKEDPWVLSGLGSAQFDGDGIATYPQDLILDGKLCTYLLGTYSSRKLNMKNNAHNGGTYNLFVTADEEHTRSFDDMLKEVGSGLVITSLMGQGVDLVSGNYSRGASGYYFENGQRVHAVDEITIAGNLKDMFASIALLGTDYDENQKIQVGSILLPNITVSGS